MAIPKGKLVTPVAFDPDGNLAALEVDAAGNLKVTGGDGVSTFVALTDTPDSFTDQAKKGVAVNAGATALEFATTFLATSSRALAYRGTNQNIPTDTLTKVLLDTELYDPGSNFDLPNSKYIVDVAGCYLVVAAVLYLGTSVVANKRVGISLYNDAVLIQSNYVHTAIADHFSASVLAVTQFAAEDEIILQTDPCLLNLGM